MPTRSYIQHKRNGKHELVAWTERRCEKCGQFLPKKRIGKYCVSCYIKVHREQKRLSWHRNKDKYRRK